MKTRWKVLSIILAVTLIFSLGFLSGQREKVMVTLDDIKRAVDDLGNVIQGAIASGKINPKQIVIVQGLSDINTSLGTIRAGDFLAMSSGEEPTAADGTGTFMSALGRMFGSKTYHIGGVKDGDLKWGANALTGELEAGDGAGLITENGLSIFNGATEIGRFGNLNGFLDYATDIYGMAMGDSDQYMTYDQTNGLKIYGSILDSRETLNANRDYYVRADGDDANTGLANTSGGAFLTLQHAIDTVSDTLNIRQYKVTINVADGTYWIGGLVLKQAPGTGEVWIIGNTTTPTDVILNGGGISLDGVSTKYIIKGFSIDASTNTFYVANGSQLVIGYINFEATTLNHIFARYNGGVWISDDCTISGGAGSHLRAMDGGWIVTGLGDTTTISGTPAFTTFAIVLTQGRILIQGAIAGSATGKRYDVSLLGLISGTGGDVNYFPGNAAGTTATGGIYD